jgi:hypothetical protein
MTNPTFSQPWMQQSPDWRLAPENQSGAPLPESVSVEDVMRFQQAMQTPLDTSRQAPLPSGPFALFAAQPATVPEPPPAMQSELLSDLMQNMVQQLMVSDGSQSFRRVRMELADDVMPGVVLTLAEEQGLLVAEFTCRQDSAYLRLSQPAQSLASQLASTLERDTVWRVVPDPATPMSFTETVEAWGRPTDARNI